MPNYKIIIGLFFLMILSSCHHKHLTVFSEFITEKDLASYYVNTPDPLLCHPDIGQRIIISWTFPNKDTRKGLYLLLSVRYHNHEEIQKWIKILNAGGTYTFSIMNREYLQKRGIQTYKVDLFFDGYLLETWKHQLWAEKIPLTNK